MQSYEAWLFLRFPGNPALNPELQAKIKDIDLLKWSALSDTQFYEKNLSTLPFFIVFCSLEKKCQENVILFVTFFHL